MGMAPMMIESEATTTRQAAPQMRDSGRRDTGFPNPDESYSEATMMTQRTIAQMMAGSGKTHSGLPNPDAIESQGMMTRQTACMTQAQCKSQGLPNPPTQYLDGGPDNNLIREGPSKKT